MPYLIVLATGFFFGKEWGRLKRVMATGSDAAAERFDRLYSGAAGAVGQKVEHLEDHIALRRARGVESR